MKIKIIALTALSLAVVFLFTTCVNQDVQTLGTEANLTALTIGDITVEDIELPIGSDQWEDDTFEMYGAGFGRVALNVPEDLVMQRIRPTVSDGARAEWGIATRTTRPGGFSDTRVPITFESDEYIYIKVTSEDGLTVNYYRFYTRLFSWVTDLYRISIPVLHGPEDATRQGPAGGAGNTYDVITPTQTGRISIAKGEAEGAVIRAETFDSNATVRYAGVTGDGEPAFQPADTPISFADQDFLYVEITAENGVTKSFYKYQVDVGRITTIASLKFSDGTTEAEAYGKGLPSAVWNDVGFGEFETADQPAGGFAIIIEPDDPDATFEYGRLVLADGTEPALGAAPQVRFDRAGEHALAIKVTSANYPDITMYYKIRVNNLAAVITRHPIPAWYYRDTPAEPLTVVLDRPPSGPLPYEYQWYEADSWYGFYGRHGTSLDEKNNLTTVNGGPGQYFYLVDPDRQPIDEATVLNPGGWYTEPLAWILPGETGSTFTPRTDWYDSPIVLPPGATQNNSVPIAPDPPGVNFLQGSTNESRYYWVKVTDPNTGLSVTSNRTLILTESERAMDHFIFDLSLIQKKNLVPFTAATKDTPIQIPLQPIWDDLATRGKPVPSPEQMAKYQILIAHAQYFLPDGRPWTQNWTHGDLHFGYSDGSLVWWHNNMGANGGSIPLQSPHSAQGGMEKKPDWIGFKPSGDPEKGMPRLDPATGRLPMGIYSMSANDPYPAGVAQGYFAGFIELLEIRFSTEPPRD